MQFKFNDPFDEFPNPKINAILYVWQYFKSRVICLIMLIKAHMGSCHMYRDYNYQDCIVVTVVIVIVGIYSISRKPPSLHCYGPLVTK